MEYIYILLAIMVLILGVRWHAKVSAYICYNCNHRFTISPYRDFISPHKIKTKYLTCPSCGTKGWMKVIRK
ncbi:hypothetical protein SAMN05660297_02365 [Natronincola peptidivorans]|uniref:Uncharacterized protein n=1 Tax=Natronincola peptidivorans TaxID=426128 RepID=A0A1I0EAV0_9FIRM|nr:hypothetical protein [Natronincola peptidivorans]SET42340.1 hypothetical protein SAMN05660297_02365 [Natronincola peptidivorans]